MGLKSLSQRIEFARMESWCLGMIKECLGCSSMRLGVPFIAPRQLRAIGGNLGRPLFMSGARFPSKSGAADRCRLVVVGAPDTVRCTPDSPVPPIDRWSEPRVTHGFGGRPLRWRPLAHRTVRCTTGQSGEL
jgi:hypothetical protein